MRNYEERVLNIIDNAKDHVMEQLDKAYKSGYEDAKSTLVKKAYADGYANAKSELGKKVIDLAHEESDRAYQQGLDDAWEAAGELYKMSFDDESELFGTKCPYFDFSIQEILNIIKEYESKQKQDTEIKVGDEVYLLDKNHPRVVTNIFDDGGRTRAVQITGNGKWIVEDIKNIHKTGRYFPQIAEVLKEMRNESK